MQDIGKAGAIAFIVGFCHEHAEGMTNIDKNFPRK